MCAVWNEFYLAKVAIRGPLAGSGKDDSLGPTERDASRDPNDGEDKKSEGGKSELFGATCHGGKSSLPAIRLTGGHQEIRTDFSERLNELDSLCIDQLNPPPKADIGNQPVDVTWVRSRPEADIADSRLEKM